MTSGAEERPRLVTGGYRRDRSGQWVKNESKRISHEFEGKSYLLCILKRDATKGLK